MKIYYWIFWYARQSILELKWFDYFSPNDFKGIQIQLRN